MKILSLFAPVLVLGVGAVHAQVIYPSVPDWESTDTPYSTGGALVDINQDGWLDFVVGNGNDMRREYLAVYYGQGDGTFPLSPDWLASDAAYNGHISIADVNGDGWLDVAVGTTGPDPGVATARVYLNNAGTFSSLPDWESPDELGAFHVAFGDVNGDGRPDLAVGTGFPYTGAHQWHNYVYMNVGGTLEATASWVSADTWDLMDLFFCDYDNDGWLELIGAGTRTDTWVYENSGGTLATTAVWHTTDMPTQFSVMGTYGDVDADGQTDLFVTDNTQLSSRNGKLHGDGPGSDPDRSGPRGTGFARRYDGRTADPFTATPTWTHYEGNGSAVALSDLDADGDLDLATGSWWGTTNLFYNDAGLYPATPDFSSGGTSVVEAIVFADVDNNGRRWPVESFDASATPGRHLFQLSRQPVEQIESVVVDGATLSPSQLTYDLVHGWVSVGPEPAQTVTVAYVFTFSPEMAITNWDDGKGNYLYYNQRNGTLVGDFDADNDVDTVDQATFVTCFTGPGGSIEPACEPGDADLDGDVDCDDWARFQQTWTGPGSTPTLPQCLNLQPIPTLSGWGVLSMLLLILVSATALWRRRPGHAHGPGI